MVYLFGLLVLLFGFIGIVPLAMTFAFRHHADVEIQYTFPQKLFHSDMDHLRYEEIEGKNISRISLQNRGSVRLARGNILSMEDLVSRKGEAYSVELP